MRLWHKDLIHYLPQKQLVAQWRECCGIARNINVLGHPNHILVNKIMDYPIEHFIAYSQIVANEMRERGYTVHWERFMKWFPAELPWNHLGLSQADIFNQWQDKRYLRQCFYNLQEKADNYGLSQDEYGRLYEFVWEELGDV